MKNFNTYVQEHLKIADNIESIRQEAIHNGEDRTEVAEDLVTLSSKNPGISSLGIYYKALIYSQLYQVKLTRHQTHTEYTLNDLTKLNRYTNSFVCHYDKDSKSMQCKLL